MPSWLSKQRKQTLLDLAGEAGMQHDESARKEDLIEALDTYLQQNATRFAGNATFEPYYGTRRTPGRARESMAAGGTTSGEDGEVKSVVKGRGRRPTKVKQEQEDEDEGTVSSPSNQAPASSSAQSGSATAATTAVAKRTPARPRRRPELPPSPADVAADVEYAATRFYAGLDDFYSVSGIPETIDYLRDFCSSVTGVQLTCLLFEAYGLQKVILPWKYAGFDIPGLSLLGLPSIAVYLPDLFKVLEGSFWTTTLLWSTTSIFVPALFAYFYNLTVHTVKRHGVRVTVARYTADPLTFHVIKALLTYLVYTEKANFGIVDSDVAARVNYAMYGGYNGVLIGSYICILASMYEAAQRR